MAPNLSLFGRTKQLELQIDSFFDKVSEAAVVFRLGVRVYLKKVIQKNSSRASTEL